MLNGRATAHTGEALAAPVVRRTKIVATIGPASKDPEVLVEMVRAGMDVARLNLSHGDHAQHARTAADVRDAANRAGRPVAILQDLPGPTRSSSRTTSPSSTTATSFTFHCGEQDGHVGSATDMTISFEGLADAIDEGDVIYLADGSIRLRTLAGEAPRSTHAWRSAARSPRARA